MDYERKLPVAALPAETKPAATTYKVDAFFEMVKNLVLAAEWFMFKNRPQSDGRRRSTTSGGWSAFGRYKVKPDKLQLFARYDSYMPNSLDRDLDMSLVIAGFDWAPYHASWKLQPNVWFYNYRTDPLQRQRHEEQRHRLQPDVLPVLLRRVRIKNRTKGET